jgi:hypothetical protein
LWKKAAAPAARNGVDNKNKKRRVKSIKNQRVYLPFCFAYTFAPLGCLYFLSLSSLRKREKVERVVSLLAVVFF